MIFTPQDKFTSVSVLKHENNALAQTFVGCIVRTQHPNIFAGLHFYLSFKQQFRLFIFQGVKSFIGLAPGFVAAA